MRSSLLGILLLLLLSISVGCTSSPAREEAARAVEGYLNALVGRDLNRMIQYSCAAWEAQARLEYNSFNAVALTSRDLHCETAELSGEQAQVKCQGVIIANYGAEDLEIDAAEQTYLVRYEGGEWRMCGYAQP